MKPLRPQIDPAYLAALNPADREEALAALAQWEEVVKTNPLWAYTPHPKQQTYHGIKAPIAAFIGGNRCEVAGTLVRMGDGATKPIETIQPGERVMGSDAEGNTRPVTVLHRFDNGLREVYRWRFGKRQTEVTLDATEDHVIAGWHEKRGRWQGPLGEVARPLTRSRYSAQRALGWQPETEGEGEEYALLWGLLLGDGYIPSRRDRALQFACADPDVLAATQQEADRFGYCLKVNPANTIQYRIVQQERVLAAQSGETGRFVTGSRSWLRDVLEEHGLAVLAHDKSIPAVCWDWSNAAVGRLLAGLILTDGSVYPAPEGWRVNFTSVSKPLTDGVRRLLEDRFGVYGGRLTEHTRPDERTTYQFTVGNYESLRRFRDAVPLVGRKAQKIEAALDEWDGKRSDGARLRFRGKERMGWLPTHDLLVDHPDHFFVLANGLVTHNSGKTTAGIADDLIQTVDADALPPWLRAYKRWPDEFYCRVITVDLNTYLAGVIIPKVRELVPKDQLFKGSWDRAYDKRARRLQFANGNWWDFMTFDMDLEQFGGAALHRVHIDEEPPGQKGKLIWEESEMRTIDYDGEMRMTMTPLMGLSWTYYILSRQGDPRWDEECQVVMVDMDENPFINQTAKKRILKGKSETEKAARKSGRWIHFAGLIYPQFDPDEMVVPEWESVPQGQPVYVGIDPGIRHQAGVVWVAYDQHDVLTVFHELALQGVTINGVCARIFDVNDKYGIEPRWYVIDPASRTVSQQTGRSDQTEYVANGIATVIGQNARTPGYSRIQERMETERFQITANCEVLVQQMKEYRWKSEKGRMEDAPKEEPVKRNDHLLDALRYVEMSMPQKQEIEVLDGIPYRLEQHRARLAKRQTPAKLGAIFGVPTNAL